MVLVVRKAVMASWIYPCHAFRQIRWCKAELDVLRVCSRPRVPPFSGSDILHAIWDLDTHLKKDLKSPATFCGGRSRTKRAVPRVNIDIEIRSSDAYEERGRELLTVNVSP